MIFEGQLYSAGGYYHDRSSGITLFIAKGEDVWRAFVRYGSSGSDVDAVKVAGPPIPGQPVASVSAYAASPPPPPSHAPSSTAPEHALPKISFPVIRSKIAPVVTGEPISTAVLTGLAFIFGIFGGGGIGEIKAALTRVVSGLKDISNTLMNFIWTMSHIGRWILNALRQLWEKVLSPLIDHINSITQKIAKIITKVLRPYLDLIQKIRKHILEIYARFVLPVIRVIQQIRVMLTILKLLHVPGVKALDEKLAKIEGKLIGVIQAILSRVNDHSGLLNILLTARATIQHGILVRSLYETQGAWVNQWWNAQEWQRSSEDAEAAVQLDLAIQEQPEVRELDEFLRTRTYVSTHVPVPEEQELTAMLMRGRA